MMRRTAGVILFAVLLTTTGCMGLLTGDATFRASPATVGQATLSDTGYELARSDTQNISRTFSVAGQQREVTVTNHLREYTRSVTKLPIEKTEIARFALLSTPAVEIAGRTFNPVSEWSEPRIVRQLSQQYEGIRNVKAAGNRSVGVLGEQRTVERFAAEATLAGGRTVDVYIHVTKFRHGDDFILALAIHPQAIDERDNVDALLAGISH